MASIPNPKNWNFLFYKKIYISLVISQCVSYELELAHRMDKGLYLLDQTKSKLSIENFELAHKDPVWFGYV